MRYFNAASMLFYIVIICTHLSNKNYDGATFWLIWLLYTYHEIKQELKNKNKQ